MRRTWLAMSVTAAAAALVLSGCSSDPAPPEPAPVAAPSVDPASLKPLPQGKPFEVTQADMRIHSFLADPETNSGGFRMNCYPLWRDIETKKGTYNWELFDLGITNQKAWGAVDLMYSFCGTPQWAADGKGDPSVEVFGPQSAIPPKDLKDYEDYVRAVVKRYKGQISAYETWNEASSPQFWQGTPEQMVQMTEILQKVVKEEDPKALTTMASMQTHREDYFKNFAVPYLEELKAADWPFDVYNGHFYPTLEGGPAKRREQIDMFRDELKRLDAPNKPLWDTEVNYYTGVPGGEPDGRIVGQRAAAWAVRTYLDGWRLDVPRSYWYFATQEYNAFPGIQTRPGDPATRALATFADWTVGTEFNGCDQTSDFIKCAFLRDDQQLIIAWAESKKGNDGENPRASYPLDGPATVCRLPDNTCETTSVLTLDEVPVLIAPPGVALPTPADSTAATPAGSVVP